MGGLASEFSGSHAASFVAIAPSLDPGGAAATIDWSDDLSVTAPPSRFGRVGSFAAARWGRLRLLKLILVACDLMASHGPCVRRPAQ